MPAEYEFGPFRVDVARRALYREGEYIALTPKAAEILVLLLEEAGRVVTKEQLLERVWPGVVVEEGAIANNVSALRKALDPGFNGEAPIATVARRGYRFAAEVRPVDGNAAVTPAAASAASPVTPAPANARNTVLVADIENKTGDPVFDGTIKQALLLHLAQSPFIEVLSDFKVHSLLRYMNKRGAPVVGDVALEICQRTGTKAAITGSIFAIGDDYVIGIQAVHGDTGDILLTEQARARGKNEILKALDLAAIGLRTKLGESLASVQTYFKKFDEVATSSLEALKAYTLGRREWWEHGEAAAKPHQLRAIGLDPHFASAYSALAIACNNMGETIEAQRYMQQAYELRDRMSERERTRADANYHDVVTGDIFKGIDALRAMQASPYVDATAFGNMGSLLAQGGQWDKALAAGLRAMDMEPSAIIASNVALAQLALGLTETARGTFDDAFSRGWDPFYLHLEAYQEAFLRGDEGAMKGHFDAVAGREEEDFLLAAAADTEAYYGRYARARELSRRAVESARRAETLEMAGSWEALAAFREAVVGNGDRACEGALAALEISDGRYVMALAGLALALGGDEARAKTCADRLDQHNPQRTIVQRNWLPCIRAALAIGKEDWKVAIDALEPAAAVELGTTLPFECGLMIAPYLRGLALQGAGREGEGSREFMKIVERPGLIRNFVLYPLALKAAGLEGRFQPIWAGADRELRSERSLP
jgi:DNA-binding winged helix-turn-helix (wHTH) protein/tetratricopeptide (TPR) repeat protein